MSEKKTRAELRKFGLTLGIAFLALAGLVWWRGHSNVAIALAALGASLLAAGLLVPGWLSGFERAWMGLALVLSKFTTPIFMGIVYFLVVTPIGLLMRALGRDPLAIDTGEEDTLWVKRQSGSAANTTDMRRQF